MNKQKRKKINKSNPMIKIISSSVEYDSKFASSGLAITAMRFKNDGLKKKNDLKKQQKRMFG